MGAYGIWGLLPIFFKLLHAVTPVEVVSQRIIWSLALILVLLAARRNLAALVATLRNRRLLLPLTLSALFIAINWLVYVWAVNDGHVVAASLGYFLNPLVNVALGVLVLKERLRRGQAIAIGVAAVGVAIMAAAAITTLWISVALAISFALYGLIRKLTPVAPLVGLGAETLILTPVALAYLVWLWNHGGISLGRDSYLTSLLVASGALTTVPLVLFAMAAQRLPLATLGLTQYLAPTLQFFCGVFLYGEKLTHGQVLSFALIWIGLILFATDSYAAARRGRLAVS
ncbi:EamA family transporter RarD [Sphingobium sp. MI1205]|uniref:EamA family transporter RarD n=1 Tax=Sphingobium sp. MI1205 TaxID=407020 RepID=UPI0007814D31|nr:EamA family transporter RarD [Sphingobium sp. MI1205]